MKLSISLPDVTAREIRSLANQSERSVSWWIQQAWSLARTRLLRGDEDMAAKERAMKKLRKLMGALKKDYPDIDSVTLAHQAPWERKKSSMPFSSSF